MESHTFSVPEKKLRRLRFHNDLHRSVSSVVENVVGRAEFSEGKAVGDKGRGGKPA